jgi:hypothetical protein
MQMEEGSSEENDRKRKKGMLAASLSDAFLTSVIPAGVNESEKDRSARMGEN